MLFGSSSLIGLDIGTSSIKLVEVDNSKKNPVLKAFGFVPTPPGSIVGGEISDPGALASAISRLVQQSGVGAKKACTAIWGTAAISKKISIPRIEENLLQEQLRWEAEQYIPFDINEINLGYHVLRGANNPENMDVLLVAAKKDYVLRFAEVVESAGLDCEIVDVAGFALSNCFEMNYGKGHGNIGLLNFGAGVTNFVVLEDGDVGFARDVPVGGNTYTSDIQKTMGVSMEEAESLKISAGTGQPVPKEVSEVLAQTNEAVADELMRSYEFYQANTGAEISKIFVTGGGLGLPGLFEAVQLALKVELKSFNPFNKVQYSRDYKPDFIAQISPYISVGMGLALRSGGDS